MEASKPKFLKIEPTQSLYFEGPFTQIVTSYINLINLQDVPVCFKVKTTVPKRYCVRPSSGLIKPNEKLDVAVMLQPFAYEPSEKAKHKFMIQSLLCPDEENTNLEHVWKNANPSDIGDHKLICVILMPGELNISPANELTFDEPSTSPVSSIVTLTNRCDKSVCFRLSTGTDYIRAFPNFGVVSPNSELAVKVVADPMDDLQLERVRGSVITIKSAVYQESDKSSPDHVLQSDSAIQTTLKYAFRTGKHPPEMKLKAEQAHSLASVPDPKSKGSHTTDYDTLLMDLKNLRMENQALKMAELNLRRTALSDTCLTSAAGGGAAIGRQGAVGMIACIPPILYLALAMLIGLFLGKYIL